MMFCFLFQPPCVAGRSTGFGIENRDALCGVECIACGLDLAVFKLGLPPPPPPGLGVCIWMHPVNGTATAPSPGRPAPGVVKQDKSSGGSVDTTKTRSGPQRVRMSSGERPIGAAKGKQSDTEALCHPPPPPQASQAMWPRPLPRHHLPFSHPRPSSFVPPSPNLLWNASPLVCICLFFN